MQTITTQKAFDAYRKARKLPPLKVSPNILLALKDGMPPFLIMSEQERKDAWKGVTVRPMPSFTNDAKPAYRSDADHAAFLEAVRQQEEGKRMARQEKAEAKKNAEPKTPKAKRATGFSVQDIAKELGVLPRDARAALRAAKIAKPAGGWATDDKRVADAWREAIKNKPAKEKKAKSSKGDKSSGSKGKLSASEKKELREAGAKGEVITSGKANKKGNGAAPEATNSKKDNDVSWEVTAVKRPKLKDWVMRANGVLVKDENDKPRAFKTAKDCTAYAKKHYNVGCGFKS